MAKLFVVPTPIGNLEDFTFRAVRILEESNLILAEDTRTSAKLMAHYNISTPMRSHHMHNEHKTVEKWVGEILNGNTIALITDAGTPAISDPGFLLVRECIKNDIEIDCLPGATAFVPALVNSGLPCDKFTFEGFLPQKKGRQTRLKALAEETKTMVFYESPYRVKKTLEQFIEYMGEDRQVSVSREISKKFEETVRGSVSDVLAHFDAKEPKGEFVIVLEGLK
ncbi:MAG: 16S rRNA (cytidine(1402)-2'-O)-methyltransferase [Flavobacteriales bacterium]|jgi:16S rRNA (cytidine1402-2'-O)-methyltransferase|nr:16S rRNA (cytidine(1402)-2'-O)-methyltransferase [Flavobacteriales bacterium]MDG1916544.1 16S rRNA (cytidine(1402)-2'-O)-methyltransferase [Flavobacteriales bacterium]|tara:strand:+ start:16308 stop:16979 length:672 start_codon:yes stop_codon:yes gene_type:complete